MTSTFYARRGEAVASIVESVRLMSSSSADGTDTHLRDHGGMVRIEVLPVDESFGDAQRAKLLGDRYTDALVAAFGDQASRLDDHTIVVRTVQPVKATRDGGNITLTIGADTVRGINVREMLGDLERAVEALRALLEEELPTLPAGTLTCPTLVNGEPCGARLAIRSEGLEDRREVIGRMNDGRVIVSRFIEGTDDGDTPTLGLFCDWRGHQFRAGDWITQDDVVDDDDEDED